MKLGIGIFVLIVVALASAFFLIRPKELSNRGHTVTQWLKILRTSPTSVDDPLKILKITKNNKLGDVGFEVALSYDLLKTHDFLAGNNNGQFHLVVNDRMDLAFPQSATNGNCVLWLAANDLVPGTNRIQVEFMIFGSYNPEGSSSVSGPVVEFVSSNVCRVDEKIWIDHSKEVVILWGDLSIQDARYRIELLDTNGNRIKTISGITTNGTINESWNFIGDSGKRYSPDDFNPVFHVALTNSL